LTSLTSLVACYLKTKWLFLEYSLSRFSEDWIGNTYHGSSSLVGMQCYQLLFIVGETSLAAPYMQAPVTRHTAPSLRLFVLNSLTVRHLLLLLRVVLCDVLLPVDQFLSSDHSPTATTTSSLRALIPSSPLLTC
jgi:hypothetical protein